MALEVPDLRLCLLPCLLGTSLRVKGGTHRCRSNSHQKNRNSFKGRQKSGFIRGIGYVGDGAGEDPTGMMREPAQTLAAPGATMVTLGLGSQGYLIEAGTIVGVSSGN